MNSPPGNKQHHHRRASTVYFWLIAVLQLVMLVGLVIAAFKNNWFDVLIISGIILVMVLPVLVGHRYHLKIPLEFELAAVLFVFATLFLGEIHGYYIRFWWWDIALHASSGFLLGILGFLMIYVLNENSRVDLHMRPRFVALFAFIFAVAIGALWEVFEFAMDQLAGTNMQKPMWDDLSGLTDTMWDMIVNTVGAGSISFVGWWHMKMRRHSVFDAWIARFIADNEHMFANEKGDS